MTRYLLALALAASILVICPARVRAEGDGQADLDEALRAKVTTEDLRDLNHVVELLESAIDKGLDVENSDFAEQLLCESLLERADQLGGVLQHIPVEQLADPRMSQVRDLATSDLRRIMTYDNPPPQALALLAQLLSLPGGDRREARRLLDKLFDDPKAESLPARERAETLILRASLQSNPEKAKADYDAAVDLTPTDPDALLARADFHRQQKEYDQALADVATLLAKDPESPTAYVLRAQIERSQEKWADALASLAKAAELAPAAVTPLQARGEIRRQQDDYAGAIEDFGKVLELQPGNLMALVHRAEAYLSSEQYDLALADVEAALKEEPGLVVGHAMRAQILASLKRLPEAIDEMEKLAAAVPQQSNYKMQLALYYLIAEEPRKAIKAYSEVIAAEADNFSALRSRGDAYLNIGDHAAAIADFGKALPLRPDDTSLLNNFAWVLATSPEDGVRNGKQAVELATKACELTEFKKPHILSTLAAAYAESGDFETARKWSKQAVATRDEADDQEQAKEMAEQLSKELASYEANKPWRERMAAKAASADETQDAPKTDAPAGSQPPAEAKSAEPTAQSASQPSSR